MARNNLKELHTGNIPSISSLRVGHHHVMIFRSCVTYFQVLYARHNELRDSGIPSDLFKLEHLATLVSNPTYVLSLFIVDVLTGF